MQKILHYTVSDLCADAEGISEAITHACKASSGPYRVRGLVQAEEEVYLVLLPAPGRRTETYRFAEIYDTTGDSLVALLNERWAAGFDTVGSVAAGDGLLLVLFARSEGPA